MNSNLTSYAEKQAEVAETLPAFSGLKLLHIKHQVSQLLSLIGRDGLFSEYTKHDISHIDEMLKILDWLVPATTKTVMTPADWLLTVLAVYFHDLGMLVTRDEYEARQESDYLRFAQEKLFAGAQGLDYRAKVEHLPEEQKSRFLYQEFIRHKHAERTRLWIEGKAPPYVKSVATEVDTLLANLDPVFRRDLGLVCESHHKDDLNDISKYPISRPYGNTEQEAANLQYAAILLRTTDLLHVTRDRTPSTLFHTINPTDPVSQQEWAKQLAVRSIRSKLGLDRDGNPQPEAPRDTIEVHAFFRRPDGFFGLTAYLAYAQAQLQQSFDWARQSNQQTASKYQFPWRYLDESNVEAEGFLPNTFSFTLDQGKVLDLLTGHTLYNDTGVVLRELVQNSLDALRLQRLIDGRFDGPRVTVKWDSKQRMLSVRDNGTGMTQEIIERHFLTVGSSRYQDEAFKRTYPEFSPISRFGIGVLSAFMIADSVDVFTVHPDEEFGRFLSLRSVHGRYLVRLLDKNLDETIAGLGPHGTLVQLMLRASADIPPIAETMRKWIVIPGCDVSLYVDDDDPITIGYDSAKRALEDRLRKHWAANEPWRLQSEDQHWRVIDKTIGDNTLAFAVQWSQYFREWSFIRLEKRPGREQDTGICAICLGGIGVEFATPGFEGDVIAALVDATGANAPKTNVARSGLESTVERGVLCESIYRSYLTHVREEMEALHADRGFSLSWAVNESAYLMSPLLASEERALEGRVRYPDRLDAALLDLAPILVEENGERKVISIKDLHERGFFWTVDGGLFRAAERFIREIPAKGSVGTLLAAVGVRRQSLPEGPVVCDMGAVKHLVLADRELDQIVVDKEERRIDLRWVACTSPKRWASIGVARGEDLGLLGRRMGFRLLSRAMGSGDQERLWVGRSEVRLAGLTSEVGVNVGGAIYLRPDSSLAEYLNRVVADVDSGTKTKLVGFLVFVAVSNCLRQFPADAQLDLEALSSLLEIPQAIVAEMEDELLEVVNVLNRDSRRVFSPNVWFRGAND
jgi:hypothetical protein